MGLGLGLGLGLELGFGLVLDWVRDCVWIAFYENMSSGILFSDILGFVGHLLVSFCVSGTSFDVFGVLGTSGCSKQGHQDMPLVAFGLHFGSLFGAKSCYFFMFFLIAFLDVIFTDFK